MRRNFFCVYFGHPKPVSWRRNSTQNLTFHSFWCSPPIYQLHQHLKRKVMIVFQAIPWLMLLLLKCSSPDVKNFRGSGHPGSPKKSYWWVSVIVPPSYHEIGVLVHKQLWQQGPPGIYGLKLDLALINLRNAPACGHQLVPTLTSSYFISFLRTNTATLCKLNNKNTSWSCTCTQATPKNIQKPYMVSSWPIPTPHLTGARVDPLVDQLIVYSRGARLHMTQWVGQHHL